MSALPQPEPEMTEQPALNPELMSDRALLIETVVTLRALRQIIDLIGNADTPMTRMFANMFGIK